MSEERKIEVEVSMTDEAGQVLIDPLTEKVREIVTRPRLSRDGDVPVAILQELEAIRQLLALKAQEPAKVTREVITETTEERLKIRVNNTGGKRR